MNTNAVSHDPRRASWWKRLLWSLGTATGLFSAGVGPPSAAAQGTDYRSATAAPAAWQEFARQLQGRFQQRLAADDARAQAFQDYMAKRAAGAGATTATLIVRAWILPDGNVDRLEFDGLEDDAVPVNLESILANGDVGAPPPDMLQPLRLRLSLRPNDQPEQGK